MRGSVVIRASASNGEYPIHIGLGPEPQTFTFAQDDYVSGDDAGGRIKNVKTAWETAVLKAHGVKAERTRGKLSARNRAKLSEIDLNFHDLRHEAGSSKPDGRWTRSQLGSVITKLETTAKYLNVTAQYLRELNDRPTLTLVRSGS